MRNRVLSGISKTLNRKRGNRFKRGQKFLLGRTFILLSRHGLHRSDILTLTHQLGANRTGRLAQGFSNLVKTIIALGPKDGWTKAIAGAIKEPPAIPVEIGRQLDDLTIEHGVDGLDAALLLHCRTEAPQES
jgi:hypothetical protein